MRIILCFICLISVARADGEFKLFLKDTVGRSSSHARDIYIYYPPGYNSDGKTRYPVLYMHDGQNLFDSSRATFGETWHVTETLNLLITKKIIPPILVVGIDNTSDREEEYTHDNGGRSQIYLEYLTYDLKRYIDYVLPTMPDREHTGLLGSSLGGLVSAYGGAKFSEEFGLIGAMSPSVWWNNKSIIGIILNSPPPHRIYVDSGTEGGESPEDAELLVRAYKSAGTQEISLEIRPGLHTMKNPGP